MPSLKRLTGYSIIGKKKSISIKRQKLFRLTWQRFLGYKGKLNQTVGFFSIESFKEAGKMLCSLFVRQVTRLISANCPRLASQLHQLTKVHSHIY